ncbi:putative triosephosphate isomerase like protein [Verticillium longisporum]|uniref:Triosephosphate isomerase n=1 Tax=Verticillium longisporum TaxID=100787 RepID=A0A8I2ZK45_VERLO|nr:putative triosephosphate isomerase like protein [Verticillium longisporum]
MDTVTPRRRLIGLSTKMYFSPSRTKEYLDALLPRLATCPGPHAIDIFLIPDFLSLPAAVTQTGTAPLLLGAQDCYAEDAGAYTGEISPASLAELGVRIVELGHAERRRLFGETDASTAAKAAAAARNGLIPLVCVGELDRPLAAGDEAGAQAAAEALRPQVESVLAAVPPAAEVVLAYEPVWAIGAAEPAAAEHVLGVVRAVRAMACVQGREGRVRILYGGSAGPGTFARLKGGVDGLFLGRFGHDVDRFWRTVEEVASA